MSQHSAQRIRLLDLFSGAGGLSTGFMLGYDNYKIATAVENDPAAATTYALNHEETNVFIGDIATWLKSDTVPAADIIIGGPPCQGFSALGKRDQLDARNQLWLRYAETIRRVRPKYFVLENVPSFLASVQYKRFKRQCQPSGPLGDYTFQAKILNAADYGAAQIRKRVILIGHLRELPFPGFPQETHSKAPDGHLPRWRTLRDVLFKIPTTVSEVDLQERQLIRNGQRFTGAFKTSELHLTRNYQELSLERFKCIPPDGNRFDIREDLLPKCWRNHRTGSGDVMGRLNYEKPSVTIRTEFFKPEKGRYLHPTENRAITHHEAARIQGFPDTYNWVGSKTAIAKQIGNAVPIPLAAALGSHLASRMTRAENGI